MTKEDQQRVRMMLKLMNDSTQVIIALKDHDVYVTELVTHLIVEAAELGLEKME